MVELSQKALEDILGYCSEVVLVCVIKDEKMMSGDLGFIPLRLSYSLLLSYYNQSVLQFPQMKNNGKGGVYSEEYKNLTRAVLVSYLSAAKLARTYNLDNDLPQKASVVDVIPALLAKYNVDWRYFKNGAMRPSNQIVDNLTDLMLHPSDYEIEKKRFHARHFRDAANICLIQGTLLQARNLTLFTEWSPVLRYFTIADALKEAWISGYNDIIQRAESQSFTEV